MEQKITIIINNQKDFKPKGELNLKEIRAFIKKEYDCQKECNIELYNKDFSKSICNLKDLEKLKEKTGKSNEYLIRISFKERDEGNLSKSMYTPPSNIINNEKVENKNKNMNTKVKNNLYKNNKQSNSDKELIELKNILKKEISYLPNSNKEIEDENFDEEMKIFKQNQQKEIESLEKELNDLKRINKNLEIDLNDNNNIILNNDLIENLKKAIIKEINSKIDEELIKKLQEININELNNKNENYINEQIEKKKKEINKDVNSSFKERIKKQEEIGNKFKNLNIINNKNESLEDNNPIKNRIVKNQRYYRIKKADDKKSEGINNLQLINIHEEADNNNINHEEDIKDDEENNLIKSNNKINNMNINLIKKQNQNFNNRNSLNNNLNNDGDKIFGDLKKEQPNKLIQNDKYLKKFLNPSLQKKKSNDFNYLVLFNNIFFKNKEQTIINSEKISEYYKELIKKEYFKHIEEKNNRVSFYANAFIRSNVLKIFKQRNISKDTLDIIKYNISSILECIEMNKDYYAAEYFPELKNDKKLSRRSSVETAKIFRKEFNIKEEDLNEDVLIDTLNNNNNDIYQTFQIIYGK